MNRESLRALVVDDEPALRALTVQALTQRGIVCDGARDGDAALALFEEHDYDLLITDLRMPRKHGHALIIDVLARGENRPVIVVLTGVLDCRLAEDLIFRGVDAIEFKPVNFSLLAAKVSALCERRRREKDAGPAVLATAAAGHCPA